jgi:GxxExxY protein
LNDQNSGLKYGELTEKILGVYYDVYNELGPGFIESVYEKALAIALREAGLQVQTQFSIPVWFRGQLVGNFSADVLVNGVVLLELKAAKTLDMVHQAQLMHYLKATEIEVGLLLNFGGRPEFRRIVFENERKRIRENPRKSAVGFST